jgi:hypothetical protein
VGVNWIRSFLSQNLDLKPKFAHRLAYNRALCEDPVLINGFYTSLLKLKQQYKIVDKDIYNFNKTRFAMEIRTIAKVIYSSNHSGKPSLIQPGNQE